MKLMNRMQRTLRQFKGILAVVSALSLGHLSCGGSVHLYSATHLEDSAVGANIQSAMTRPLEKKTVVEELGIFPFKPTRGSVSTVAVQFRDTTVQPYLIGNFYPHMFGVYLLAMNEGQEEFEVPIQELELRPLDSGPSLSSTYRTTLPSAVVVDRCLTNDWKKLRESWGAGSSGGRVHRGSVPLVVVQREVNELFRNCVEYSVGENASDFSARTPGEKIVLRSGECVRILCVFDASMIESEAAHFRINIAPSNNDPKSQYQLSFVIRKTMWGKAAKY